MVDVMEELAAIEQQKMDLIERLKSEYNETKEKLAVLEQALGIKRRGRRAKTEEAKPTRKRKIE